MSSKGKVGVMFIGVNGAVATAVISGVFAIRKRVVTARGLITESKLGEGLDLVELDNFVYGGWDIRLGDVYTATVENQVVRSEIVDQVRADLKEVRALPGTTRGCGTKIESLTKGKLPLNDRPAMEIANTLKEDISSFKKEYNVGKVILVNVASTEPPISVESYGSFRNIQTFEKGLVDDDPRITGGMIYAYAALSTGCPYINFTPNVTVEIPALMEFAEKSVPIAGKDGKTGQTLYKTALAPLFKIRCLKVEGWYSTNILGGKDGEVLASPTNSITKIECKKHVLPSILGYDDFSHIVRIDYYPPRGNAKEAWDSIDFRGWLDEPMNMRVCWLGKDAILAAPLIVDMARLIDFAQRKGEKGVMKHFALFFKAPYKIESHNFFEQFRMLQEYIEQHKVG